jgi:hypothetical protein
MVMILVPKIYVSGNDFSNEGISNDFATKKKHSND